METAYTLTVVVCLASYIFLNWYEKMDLTLGDLLMFSMVAMIPIINFVFLVYMTISAITHFDISDIPTITILRGKE